MSSLTLEGGKRTCNRVEGANLLKKGIVIATEVIAERNGNGKWRVTGIRMSGGRAINYRNYYKKIEEILNKSK